MAEAAVVWEGKGLGQAFPNDMPSSAPCPPPPTCTDMSTSSRLPWRSRYVLKSAILSLSGRGGWGCGLWVGGWAPVQPPVPTLTS